ncbi:hypothetical protein ARMSODRAFT_963207 [Armillaria solidipes]|uniref:Uncharacterized protein n=1 Tax=Armillaria solidipes TaxID=1076256 RepID=A0A2H3AX70_9AGAR|nr:hypothetical protein ARMSODRAFT_963207 [Armillaria solidipes]
MSTTLKIRSILGRRHHLMTTQRRAMKKTPKKRLTSRVHCARKSTRASARLRVDMCIAYGAFALR